MKSFLALVVSLLCCPSGAYSEEEETQAPFTNDPDQLLNQINRLAARVEELENQRNDKAKVAFSASLVDRAVHTHQGPFQEPSTLLFKKVNTNIGEAYNPNTGMFTAPKGGVYFFTFTGNVGNSGILNIALLKNGKTMTAVYETAGVHNSGTNGITLHLETGDEINIVMWPNTSIFDNSNISTFSGFLIFPD